MKCTAESIEVIGMLMNGKKYVALRLGLMALGMWTWVPQVWAQGGECAPVAIPRHYGPYDYITERGRLAIVDNAHFTPDVENLRKGSTGYLGSDLSYTLNASPNHHRALLAAMRFAMREKRDDPPHMAYPISCYFDRATRFNPNDTVVRGLYAKYLHDFLKRRDEALHQVDMAVRAAKDNPFTHHNAGTLYLEMGEHQKAVAQAVKAKELGWPREDLIDKLKAGGHWPAQDVSAAPTAEPGKAPAQ